MPRRLALMSLLVPDYDDAIEFFTKIGFELLEDTDLGGEKRWVRVAPPKAETAVLLARAVGKDCTMPRRLALMSLLVPGYDEAIEFFQKIGFDLLEDTDLGEGKRWVRVAPPGAETAILLARAADQEQRSMIGNQGGGRVWLFLETDDFSSDYNRMKEAGVEFEEAARKEAYGTVAVWRDPWGNRWDLIEFSR